MKTPACSAFTRIELVVALAVLAAGCGMLFTGCNEAHAQGVVAEVRRKAAMTAQLNNGRQIYLAMRIYSSDSEGTFPAFKDPDDEKTVFKSSNAALESLLGRYLDDKKVVFNASSAWCKARKEDAADAKKVLPGDCDWAYVRGLSDTAPANWPILANAFAPGAKSYVADTKVAGGVWGGRDAVVFYAGGNGEVVATKKKDDTYFIPRKDKAEANAFEKDDDWLGGNGTEVLAPLKLKE